MFPFFSSKNSFPSINSLFPDSMICTFIGILFPSKLISTCAFPNAGTLFPSATMNVTLLSSEISISNNSCNFCVMILVDAPESTTASIEFPSISKLHLVAIILLS